MLTAQEESYIISHSYVPEHVIGLITGLSAGEPYLIDDFFCCRTDERLIFIGYPLSDRFNSDHLETALDKVKTRFKPGRISLIAPALPESIGSKCRERDSDTYYTLDVGAPVIRSPIKRNLRKAARRVTVESAAQMGSAHQLLMHEFVGNAEPPVRVKDLLYKMPDYVNGTADCSVINAWSGSGVLAAFYVVDFTAADFSNYIIGCYSRKNYVLGASDLLLLELIEASKNRGKRYIHLGLGVNQGIRRFKEKWGAKPDRKYEMCELEFRKPLIIEAIRAIAARTLASG